MSKILTVFGATGQQGGSLIDYVLKNSKLSKTYSVRGVTRDVSKAAAVALKKRGVEVVKADMDDTASLKDAVAGSYAVFAVTNFWEKASASVEIAQGKAMADAAVATGATLLIWSSLPHVTRMTGGRLSGVKHFDSKAEVEIYIRDLPIKCAFYMPACYMQNMTVMFKPKRNDEGTLEFAQPWNHDTHIPLIDIADTGKFVAPALFDPEKYNGRNFTAATAFYTPGEMVDSWTRVTGKKVLFVQIPGRTASASLSPAVVEMLKESTGLINDYSYYGPTGMEDLKWTLDQVEETPTSWEDFVRTNEPWFEDA